MKATNKDSPPKRETDAPPNDDATHFEFFPKEAMPSPKESAESTRSSGEVDGCPVDRAVNAAPDIGEQSMSKKTKPQAFEDRLMPNGCGIIGVFGFSSTIAGEIALLQLVSPDARISLCDVTSALDVDLCSVYSELTEEQPDLFWISGQLLGNQLVPELTKLHRRYPSARIAGAISHNFSKLSLENLSANNSLEFETHRQIWLMTPEDSRWARITIDC